MKTRRLEEQPRRTPEAGALPPEPSRQGTGRREARVLLSASAAFALLLLVIFGDVLFFEPSKMPSHPLGDGAKYFVAIRRFGFGELAHGNLPLWNPHSFSGMPFVGMFQSALFYPPNLIHLLLPVGKAICLELMLALFVLATSSFAWLRGHRVHGLAAFLGASTATFGAACFLRVHGGQLSVIDTLAWLPLLLLAIDRSARGPSLGWLLLGIAATTLMWLAGHPPSVYMAGLCVLVYCVPLLWRSRQRTRLAAALGVIALAPLLLAAVQILPGLAVAGDAIRQGGRSFEFASSFSFPPESLLTLLVPEAFGNADDFDRSYFGRWFYWGASSYIGAVALVLALHGAVAGRGRLRASALAIVPLMTLLALGRYSVVYQLCFELVPGFAYVRAPSKYIFFAAFFASALAAIGLSRLLEEPRAARRSAALALGLAALVGAAALWTWLVPARAGELDSPLAWLAASNTDRHFSQPELDRWRTAFLPSAMRSAGVFALAALLLRLARWRRNALLLLAVLAIAEIFTFADANRGTSWVGYERNRKPGLAETYDRAGDARVLEIGRASMVGLDIGGYALWGYDPVMLQRYAEFVAYTQGLDVTELNNIMGRQPEILHPLFRLLRGRYAVRKNGRVQEQPDALPRFLLVGAYRLAHGREQVFAALGEPGFDPRESVVLEREPDPLPAGERRAAGEIELLDESTDHVDLAVRSARPALLLITDAHASGWRARALPGSVQSEYQLLPGDWVLRVVPLAAGEHRLRVEYAPRAFSAGAWISGVAGLCFLAALVRCWRSRDAPARAHSARE